MRVQLDRFEDGGWAVVVPYPGRGRAFDVPAEALPRGARAGDVFALRFLRDEDESRRLAEENRGLMDGLLGRDEG